MQTFCQIKQHISYVRGYIHGRAAMEGLPIPHVVGAQLYRLSTVDAHTDVLKPIHGKII